MSRRVYLGIGPGFKESHDYYLHAYKAITSLHCEVIRAADELPPKDDITLDTLRNRMEQCDAILLPLCFPNCQGLSSVEQLRLASVFQIEYDCARALLSDPIPDLNTSGKAQPRKVIRLFAMKVTPGTPILQHVTDDESAKVVLEVLSTAHNSLAPADQFELRDVQPKIMSALYQGIPGVPKPAIMASSTFHDLAREREIVAQTVQALGYPDIRFEKYPTTMGAREASLTFVRDATIYLGILYARYGDSNPSLTELEYDAAQELGKPRFFLLCDPQKLSTWEAMEQWHRQTVEQRESLERLKKQVRDQEIYREYERDPEEEIPKAVLDMLSWLGNPSPDQQALPPPAWQEQEPPYVYEAHPYSLLDDQALIARAAETQKLDQWYQRSDAPRVLVLRAWGGMGKSALVWSWYQDVKKAAKETARSSEDPAPVFLWWSFYNPNAHARALASRLLEWLPGRFPRNFDRLSTHDAFEEALRRMKREGKPFLLLLGVQARRLNRQALKLP